MSTQIPPKHRGFCPVCKVDYDRRDLAQVGEHMHPLGRQDPKIDAEDLTDVRARKVGDPVEWKDGKPTQLN